MQKNKNSIAYTSNKRAILWIMGVLLTLLITLDLIAIRQQYQMTISSAEDYIEKELDLAAKFSIEPLLKDNYIKVEDFFNNWAMSNPHVTSLVAEAPNGFKLIDYKNNIETQHIIDATREVRFKDTLLLTLHLSEDVSHLYQNTSKNSYRLITLSIILIISFGYLLWLSIRKTAIAPLEDEINKRKVIEKNLLTKSRDLEYSNKELEAYSYSIAHDLRTPLRSIVSFSQILQQETCDKLDAEEIELLERIVKSGKNMSHLIDDILELSHVSRIALNKTPVNLSEIAQQQLTDLITAESNTDAQISIEENMTTRGDAALLTLLIQNLLSNALKYSKRVEKPYIEFKTASIDQENVYVIKDNGVGFDKQFAEKLFRPFERLHKKDEFPGTGIGLAMCKRIVDRHHGKIWISSEINQGTTVYFTLPD